MCKTKSFLGWGLVGGCVGGRDVTEGGATSPAEPRLHGVCVAAARGHVGGEVHEVAAAEVARPQAPAPWTGPNSHQG